MMNDNSVKTSEEEVKHICRRCGRRLKSMDSQKLGMGPVCYSKFLAEKRQKKLFQISSLHSE